MTFFLIFGFSIFFLLSGANSIYPNKVIVVLIAVELHEPNVAQEKPTSRRKLLSRFYGR